MKVRRRKWLVPSLVGVPLIVVFLLLIGMRMLSPEPVELAIVTKELPASWLEPTPAAPEPTPGGQVSRIEPRVLEGVLSVHGNGRAFAEESYSLRISEDGATLTANGRFWFKVVLATVNIPFRQILESNESLAPTAYSAQFDAPLGMGRSVEGQIYEDAAEVDRGDGMERVAVTQADAFVLGTFSTYALLPVLFEQRAEEGVAEFEVLVFGGPPQGTGGEAEASDASDRLPSLRIERIEDAVLRSGTLDLSVEQYAVTGSFGGSRIYARDGDFLGMIAGEDGEGLLVYRSDYFPDGFDWIE